MSAPETGEWPCERCGKHRPLDRNGICLDFVDCAESEAELSGMAWGPSDTAKDTTERLDDRDIWHEKGRRAP